MQSQSSKTERMVRWLVPLALIAFAAAAIYISTTFKKMPPILKRGIQPSDFPQLIAGLIIALTVLMAWRDPAKMTERVTSMTFLTFAAMVGFVLVAQIDLILALGMFAAALSALGESGGSLCWGWWVCWSRPRSSSCSTSPFRSDSRAAC